MYVYLIECECRLKIGKADNPRGRLSDMQVGCPFPLRLRVAARFADAEHALKAERKAHAHFASARVGGEWFSANIDDVVEYLTALGGLIENLNAAPRAKPSKGWSTGEKEALVSYLETHMGGMRGDDVSRLAQVHGKSTSDRHELACVIAEKHFTRKHAPPRESQPRAIRP